MGTQKKLPVPCSSAVVVKKKATRAMLALKPAGSVVGGEFGKKASVVSTMATVGPAARKLHHSIAMQMSKAMDFLYHCGLLEWDRQHVCRVRAYTLWIERRLQWALKGSRVGA